MWDFRPLRTDAERLFGREQVARIQPCLNSIHDWRDFARFHFTEAARLMGEVVGQRDEREIIDLIFEAFEPSEDGISTARFKASAHITACVHAMHSLADTIGHTLYFGLGMNLDSRKVMEDWRINMKSVASRLPAGVLADKAMALIGHEGFRYLSAINNHSKHRSLVPVSFSVSTNSVEPEAYGLKFNAFTYDGERHEPRWVRRTLVPEYHRQEVLLNDIGNALNEEVERMAGGMS